jgi:uncharacterized protein
MSHEGYHEPYELLSNETREMHRALVSLQEELEAVDWYQQRADVCTDAELKAVLVHNKNEEIEHASMTLEWIRRHSAKFDEHLGTYLNTTGSILEAEEVATGKAEGSSPDAAAAPAPSPSLGIGSLKMKKA